MNAGHGKVSFDKRDDYPLQSSNTKHGLLHYYRLQSAEAVFLNEIQTRVLEVFLLAIHSHLYSFALRFLQTHTTS